MMTDEEEKFDFKVKWKCRLVSSPYCTFQIYEGIY